MKIVLLGDIHGRWQKVQNILNHELIDGGYAFSTGDLVTNKVNLEEKKRLIFVPGNHDSTKFVSEIATQTKGQLTSLKAGEQTGVGDIRITAFQGVYSPHFFSRPDCPPKYFSQCDVENAKGIKDKIDILLTHEAPANVGFKKKNLSLGRIEITQIIEALHPRLAIFGHHHTPFDTVYKGTRIIGLDQPHRSYSVFDSDSFEVQGVHANLCTDSSGKKSQYIYSWENKSQKLFQGTDSALDAAANVLFNEKQYEVATNIFKSFLHSTIGKSHYATARLNIFELEYRNQQTCCDSVLINELLRELKIITDLFSEVIQAAPRASMGYRRRCLSEVITADFYEKTKDYNSAIKLYRSASADLTEAVLFETESGLIAQDIAFIDKIDRKIQDIQD